MTQDNLKGFRFRESTRAPFDTEVKLRFDRFGGAVSGYSADISMEGMFVRTQEPKPVGTLVQFEFKLEQDGELIQGLGDVVWVRTRQLAPNKPPGMGIQFRYVDPHSRELIFKIVDKYLKESKAGEGETTAPHGPGAAAPPQLPDEGPALEVLPPAQAAGPAPSAASAPSPPPAQPGQAAPTPVGAPAAAPSPGDGSPASAPSILPRDNAPLFELPDLGEGPEAPPAESPLPPSPSAPPAASAPMVPPEAPALPSPPAEAAPALPGEDAGAPGPAPGGPPAESPPPLPAADAGAPAGSPAPLPEIGAAPAAGPAPSPVGGELFISDDLLGTGGSGSADPVFDAGSQAAPPAFAGSAGSASDANPSRRRPLLLLLLLLLLGAGAGVVFNEQLMRFAGQLPFVGGGDEATAALPPAGELGDEDSEATGVDAADDPADDAPDEMDDLLAELNTDDPDAGEDDLDLSAPVDPAPTRGDVDTGTEELDEPSRGSTPTLDRVVDIEARRREGETAVTIRGNGPILVSGYSELLLESPPRLLIKISGVEQAYRSETRVGTPELSRIRTGLHPGELHIVFDLGSADVRTSIEIVGGRLEIRFRA